MQDMPSRHARVAAEVFFVVNLLTRMNIKKHPQLNVLCDFNCVDRVLPSFQGKRQCIAPFFSGARMRQFCFCHPLLDVTIQLLCLNQSLVVALRV